MFCSCKVPINRLKSPLYRLNGNQQVSLIKAQKSISNIFNFYLNHKALSNLVTLIEIQKSI